MQCHLKEKNLSLELSLEIQELLNCQPQVELRTKEVGWQGAVHARLEGVTSDGMVTMTHSHTGLWPDHISHLENKRIAYTIQTLVRGKATNLDLINVYEKLIIAFVVKSI